MGSGNWVGGPNGSNGILDSANMSGSFNKEQISNSQVHINNLGTNCIID